MTSSQPEPLPEPLPEQTAPFVQRERVALRQTLIRLGPEAATLCQGWTAKDLVCHLLVRERHLAALGIAVKALHPWQERQRRHLAQRSFAELVAQFGGGPPWYSPMRLDQLEPSLNSLEFFVHHEDLLRAQPKWQPRSLPSSDQREIWGQLTKRGKLLARRSPVGVKLDAADVGSVVLHKSETEVELRGTPAELTLYLHGRRDHALVTFAGSEASVERFRRLRLRL